MKLIPMTEQEYDFWATRSRKLYAADKIKANSVTPAEAERIAHADFNRLLPDGFKSKDNFLFSAQDESGNKVGFIWFCLRGPEMSRRAYICDVIIEEEYRGKGFGKQMMLLIEQEILKLGLNRIELHVFGFNQNAIKLYQSLGFETTDLIMAKTL